jgi:phytoene synthase
MPVRPELAGTARYFAWLYSPPQLRAVLGALFQIEQEIGAALRVGLDHRVAHVRLAWWRDECARFAQGHPVHPLTRALRAALPASISVDNDANPVGLVDAAVWDLAAATFATRRELSAYCARWACLTQLAAHSAAPGPAAQRAMQFGRALGAALRETELVIALAPEARAGRLRLPLDELDAAGVAAEALARPPWPMPLESLRSTRLRSLRAELAAAASMLDSGEQAGFRGLLVWAALAHRQARRAEHAPADAPHARPVRDAWYAWRAARQVVRTPFSLNEEPQA